MLVSDDYTMWNYTDNSTLSDDPGYTLARNIIVIIVYGAITLVTIVGNFLVMLAFRRDRQISRKIANWYILNLSVADFTVGLVSMSINLAWLLTDDWPLGEIPCKIFLVVDYVVTNVPVCTIIFISLDRYWLLTKKLDYPKYQTKTKATALITFSWTFCIIFFTVITFAWIPITGFEEEIEYDWNCEMEATYNINFQIFALILFFVIPLITIACLNLIVYRNIRERSKGFVQSKPIPNMPKVPLVTKKLVEMSDSGGTTDTLSGSTGGNNSTMTSEVAVVSVAVEFKHAANPKTTGQSTITSKKHREFNRHRKAAITLAVLVGVFILCWLPFYITSLIGAVCEECIPELIWEITSNLLWCNSTINPFLYAAMNLHFRNNFINLLGLKRWFAKRPDTSTSSSD